MAINIHPTAIVDKNAQLGEGVEIGPYAFVGADVKLGAGTVVRQGAIVDGHTTIGENCQIFPYACVGMKTQDLKYKEGSVSYVEIGNRTVIREFATVHLGTADGEKTIIGGCAASHQFCTIGKHAMVGGMVKIRQDVPPFMLCDMDGSSQKVIGPNIVGLKRRGFSTDVIQALKEAFRFIYHSGLNRSQALERVENDVEQCDEVRELVAFYRNSTRGVC